MRATTSDLNYLSSCVVKHAGADPRAPSRVHDVRELQDECVAPVLEGRAVAPLQHAAVRAVPAAADPGITIEDEPRRHARDAQVPDRTLVEPVVLQVRPPPQGRHRASGRRVDAAGDAPDGTRLKAVGGAHFLQTRDKGVQFVERLAL